MMAVIAMFASTNTTPGKTQTIPTMYPVKGKATETRRQSSSPGLLIFSGNRVSIDNANNMGDMNFMNLLPW
jgi:hypothetical protein